MATTRERTLYDFICRMFTTHGWRCQSQVGVEGLEPDLIFEYEDSMIVSEVKIDSEVRLTDAIVDASTKARLLNQRNAMALLFPREIRDIHPTELERIYPNLEVTALILTDWISERQIPTLSDLATLLTDSYLEWQEERVIRVNYDLVVEVARDSIREVASYLRYHLARDVILDSAMGVIGRFDVYKSLLEDFSDTTEEEAKLYIADITAYILINQILFYQIIADKLGFAELPSVNPIAPPNDLLEVLDKQFESARAMYSHILGINLFPLLEETGDRRILRSLARIVFTFKVLKPQNIKEDLFGRLYHETIPPETRKNLGAFYTKPEAAKLLAHLSIDEWDSKVLDPACGSGTLLVEAYKKKAQLAPLTSRASLHRIFIEEDIFGTDIMHFAAHMTSTNLTSQNLQTHVFPQIFPTNGLDAMIDSLSNTSVDPPSEQQLLTRWLGTLPDVYIPRDLDLVIMNPPFTRRERIPDDLDHLGEIIPEVTGKTGYWAYFIIPADKLLRAGGTMAVVMPEEFFVGRAAKCVREYLFNNGYSIQYLVRSAVEIAFSEGAKYRDYLIVLKKGPPRHPLIMNILKEPLTDMREDIDGLVNSIKDFGTSLDTQLVLDQLESLKIYNSNDFINTHIDNLKPLIGFNTIEAQKIALELLDVLNDKPTLKELEEKEVVRIRVYNPGQYRYKGQEKYARKLFVSKYGTRSPNAVFILENLNDTNVTFSVRNRQLRETVPRDSVVLSLRTYSEVKHLDITNEEEVAIVEPDVISNDTLELTGLIPLSNCRVASNDIREAYEDLAGNVLLLRRNQISSPGLFWLAYYSDRPVLGITSAFWNMQTQNSQYAKLLTIYFNSIISLIQLIAFVAETRGAWVTFHGKQVWAHIHVPDVLSLEEEVVTEALELFPRIHKVDTSPIFSRISEHNSIQRSVDEIALKMVGLPDWINRLDDIYDAVAEEIRFMHQILETSR